MVGQGQLDFACLMGYLHRVIAQIEDPRQPSNNTQSTIKDALRSAFSVFFIQCESFLQHQRLLQTQKGKDNAQTLFGVEQIPSDNQIRNILDGISAAGLEPIFSWVYQALLAGGHLAAYQCFEDNLLLALDGTEYFSSQKINCVCCSDRTHKNSQVTYFHSAITPVIVAPGLEQVIALAPELITPQDGYNKQDCEQAAAKRWLTAHGAEFESTPVTLLGDDLYSKQPLCELALAQGFNFIFTCLPESDRALYEWLDYLDAHGEVQTLEQRDWNGRERLIYHYRYVNNLPLRDTPPALMVNWCELTIARDTDGVIIYHNAFITRHPIGASNVAAVVTAGRARWKVENENNNVLKTKGYHLEHNFGHGKQHLSAMLLTLNLLAFLFHTVLQLLDKNYQLIRQRLGTRKVFFDDLRALTKYLLFDSWQHLLTFMLCESAPLTPANTS